MKSVKKGLICFLSIIVIFIAGCYGPQTETRGDGDYGTPKRRPDNAQKYRFADTGARRDRHDPWRKLIGTALEALLSATPGVSDQWAYEPSRDNLPLNNAGGDFLSRTVYWEQSLPSTGKPSRGGIPVLFLDRPVFNAPFPKIFPFLNTPDSFS